MPDGLLLKSTITLLNESCSEKREILKREGFRADKRRIREALYQKRYRGWELQEANFKFILKDSFESCALLTENPGIDGVDLIADRRSCCGGGGCGCRRWSVSVPLLELTSERKADAQQ